AVPFSLTAGESQDIPQPILTNDVSRVKLSIINNPNDDYINANYIPGYKNLRAFIAAQGPLPTTVNDFWRMIWEKDVRAVVILLHFNSLQEDVLPEWTIRDFESSTNQSHLVRHFHFTAWPDHDVPQTTDALITFRNIISDFMKNYPRTPILVHCRYGASRWVHLVICKAFCWQYVSIAPLVNISVKVQTVCD
uniref:protein-tyrosine-phosphatase n=1 Tax=Leptobrachium leishanense TaxID=445787 RepID=A0A8C5R146_9ANUR